MMESATLMDTVNEADFAVHRLKATVAALDLVVDAHPALKVDHAETLALRELVRGLEDRAAEIEALREKQWEATKALLPSAGRPTTSAKATTPTQANGRSASRIEAKVDDVLRCLRGQRAVDAIEAQFAREGRPC